MDVLLRAWAVLLFLAGVPLFVVMGVVFGTSLVIGLPIRQDAVTKFLQLWIGFALSGLMSAAGPSSGP